MASIFRSLTTDGEPPTRRERKKERTRQALLDAAMRLIAERGIYGTRVEDITERADLGKGAFYNYFESKDRLLAELVSQGVEQLYRDHLKDMPPAASHAERVAAVVAAHSAFFGEHPAYLLLFHQVRGLAQVRIPANVALKAVFVSYVRRTGVLITTEDDRRQMGEERLMDLSAVVLGAIAGYASFCHAAALPRADAVVSSVLVSGLPAIIQGSG